MLSIIIPHYNSVQQLNKLLDSIPKGKRIEVVVVDDKSDKDIDKLEALKQNPEYSGVIFLKNNTNKKGAGVCRNIGLQNVTGDWVLFADSDDFFVNNFYSNVKKYFNSNNDVVFFKPISVDLYTGTESDRHKKYERILLDYLDNKDRKSELVLRYEFLVPFIKQFRSYP